MFAPSGCKDKGSEKIEESNRTFIDLPRSFWKGLYVFVKIEGSIMRVFSKLRRERNSYKKNILTINSIFLSVFILFVFYSVIVSDINHNQSKGIESLPQTQIV